MSHSSNNQLGFLPVLIKPELDNQCSLSFSDWMKLDWMKLDWIVYCSGIIDRAAQVSFWMSSTGATNGVTTAADAETLLISLRNGYCNNAARPPPTSGPRNITQRSSMPFLLASGAQSRMEPTMAGPKERVGLMEQPSIGSKIKCAKKTAKPIAMHAFWPMVERVDTAVSQTT